MQSMDRIYSPDFWELFDRLDTSLSPAGPEQLYELAAPFLPAGGHVLDVGCRDAHHLIRLVSLTAGSGVGIDPVAWHVDRARTAVTEAHLTDRIEIVLGVAESIPSPDDAFDLVWCRDVIEVLPDLTRAFGEMARVIKAGGILVAYTNVLNGSPNDEENRAIHYPLGNNPDSLVEATLERALAESGFSVDVKHVVGTEWREHLEETGGIASRDVLRLARLRRQQQAIVDAYGEQVFATAQASTQWSIHQFLGRFVPTIYILRWST